MTYLILTISNITSTAFGLSTNICSVIKVSMVVLNRFEKINEVMISHKYTLYTNHLSFFRRIKTYVHSFAVVISSTSQLSTGAPGSSTSVQYCFLISCFASLQWFVKIFNLYVWISLPLLIWNNINLNFFSYINAAIISWTSASSPNIVTFTNIHIGFLDSE